MYNLFITIIANDVLTLFLLQCIVYLCISQFFKLTNEGHELLKLAPFSIILWVKVLVIESKADRPDV